MSSIDQSVDVTQPAFAVDWQYSDADMVLISSDNIKFAVHAFNLKAGSTIFRDMCEVAGDGNEKTSSAPRPEVPLCEDGETLKTILHFLYPDREETAPILQVPDFWPVAKACLKYNIWRGIEFINNSLMWILPSYYFTTTA